MLTLAALVAAAGTVPEPLPDFEWLAGYWLSCEAGRETAEVWTAPRGNVMLGSSVATGAGGFFWEQMRIEGGPPEAPDAISFHAQPRGAAATPFRLMRQAAGEAVFENAANDYPQRITYRREGEALVARIEKMDGADRVEWRFRAAAFNARCPS